MTTIVTATGKEFNTDYFTEHKPSQTIYFRIVGETEEKVQKVFGMKKETKKLTYNGVEYEGFTVLERVRNEGDNVWKVRLAHG